MYKTDGLTDQCRELPHRFIWNLKGIILTIYLLLFIDALGKDFSKFALLRVIYAIQPVVYIGFFHQGRGI